MNNKDRRDQLDSEEPIYWYFNWYIIVLSFFIAGPLGLLLIWFRPRTARNIKVIVSVIIISITLWMTYGAVDYYQNIADYSEQLEQQMENMKS